MPERSEAVRVLSEADERHRQAPRRVLRRGIELGRLFVLDHRQIEQTDVLIDHAEGMVGIGEVGLQGDCTPVLLRRSLVLCRA